MEIVPSTDASLKLFPSHLVDLEVWESEDTKGQPHWVSIKELFRRQMLNHTLCCRFSATVAEYVTQSPREAKKLGAHGFGGFSLWWNGHLLRAHLCESKIFAARQPKEMGEGHIPSKGTPSRTSYEPPLPMWSATIQ